MVLRILLLLFSFITYSFSIQGEVQKSTLSESSRVSLLTCSPNDDAIYALFGHSGLRVKDDSLKIDMVFDYGVFDFESNNFIYRFVKGETDYMVRPRSFESFAYEYSYRSMGVTEQLFNLSREERQQVFDALITNSLPENRVYRYNFFYDNCATRPRDIIADNINGKIEYTTTTKEQSYRDLIDECMVLTPWSRFGINILIGSGADKVITERQKDFLPIYVLTSLAGAEVNNKPLVKETTEILQPKNSPLALLKAKESNQRAANEPLLVGIIVLVAALLISYLSECRKKIGLGKLFDTILFLAAGIVGSIIFFLMFFSEHPCVDANWNLVWLNPLALLFSLLFFVKYLSKYVISYHFVNFVALTLFLVCFIFIPQYLEVAFIPYILALWVRSGANVIQFWSNKNRRH